MLTFCSSAKWAASEQVCVVVCEHDCVQKRLLSCRKKFDKVASMVKNCFSMEGCVMMQTRDQLSIPMHQVDAHNVIPVWEASDKKETAARTIRKKIHTKLPTYLTVPIHSLPS